MIVKSYLGGMRCAGIGRYLKQAPYHYDIEVRITGHDKSWVREVYYFEVEGTQENIDAFFEPINKLLDKAR